MATRTAAIRRATLIALGGMALAISASLSPGAAVAAFPGANGRIAYWRSAGEPNPHLFTILPDGSGVRQVTNGPAFDNNPAWSADGRRIVFTRLVGRTPTIVTIDANGGDLTPIVAPGAGTSFSPNGRRILYLGGRSIRTIRTDGAEPRRVLAAGDGFLTWPTYSPSGKRIAFAGLPDGKKRAGIWSIRRNGSRLRRLTDPEKIASDVIDEDPDYSPDGRHIVFHRSEGHDSEIRVVRADGSRERPIPGTDLAAFPAYAPAGDRIVLRIASGPGVDSCSDLYTMSPTGTDRRRVTNNCDPSGFGADASFPSWQPLPGPPSSDFSFAKAKKNKRRGTAKLRVRVPGPGDLRLAKTRRVKPASKRAVAAGRVALPVKPRGKARKRLRRRGRAKVKAKVTYTPDGAEPNTRSTRIRLRKRPR